MASPTALRDVGETVKSLLGKNIPELSGEEAISFDSPADIQVSGSARLSIFLYSVVESSHLRNIEPEPSGADRITYPPFTVDLFYLFTPYAQTRDAELIILEKLMQLLHDNPVLRDDMLKGNLKKSGNTEIRIVPHSITFEELNKLWERFPNKSYKLSFTYMFTPVRIPSERTRPVSRVQQKRIDVRSMGAGK